MFEINLVPDVKAEMIKAQKKRNLVFFISVAVSAVAAGLVLILLSVKIGQDVKIGSQDKQLEQMSSTLEKYDGLEELLTVQKQLSDLETIANNKTVLSRVFTVLYSILPSGEDTISISSLDINLGTSEISFDGQANAGASTDGIDYRVLESFTKSITLMKYDYGRYVDKNNNEIPTMCIFEADASGNAFRDQDGNLYAIWAKNVKGCDPSLEESEGEEDEVVSEAQIQNVNLSAGCDGKDLVCIYRTPQYSDWYRKGYMTTSGEISNVEHFASRCIEYSGVETGNNVVWNSTNSCDMAPEGIEVSNSSNGKETGGELVLRFSAVLHMNPEVFSFANKHMITIAPTGRQNVTDSFIQVGDMFSERAADIGE